MDITNHPNFNDPRPINASGTLAERYDYSTYGQKRTDKSEPSSSPSAPTTPAATHHWAMV